MATHDTRSADRSGFEETQVPLADQARELGLDADAISQAALRAAVKAEKERRWAEENQEAMDDQNAWVEKHGLPLAKYRMC